MKLLVFYLSDNNRHFAFPHFVKLLEESNIKKVWKLIVLTHNDDVNFYKNILNSTEINHEEFLFSDHNNYLNKVNFAIKHAKDNDIKYMMKCDNDIFMRGRTLDYMINNLELLDNDNNLTLGPLLSSGIPCVEYFIAVFLTDEQQITLKNKFIRTEFTDLWGAKYTGLNKFTTQSDGWDGNAFLDGVKQLSHHYKGIHPIRVNLDAISYLNSCIVKNKSRFYDDSELSTIADNKSPYLCNSIFCIKTSTYETLVNDRTLYVDSFEEVPLNKYSWKNNTSHMFVKNGFAIHPYYNTFPNYRIDEEKFCNDFFNF